MAVIHRLLRPTVQALWLRGAVRSGLPDRGWEVLSLTLHLEMPQPCMSDMALGNRLRLDKALAPSRSLV